MYRMYNKLADKIIDGYQITQDEALNLLSATKLTDIFSFLNGANRIRDFLKDLMWICAESSTPKQDDARKTVVSALNQFIIKPRLMSFLYFLLTRLSNRRRTLRIKKRLLSES